MIIESSEMDIPEVMIQSAAEENVERYASQMGVSPQQLMQYMGLQKEEVAAFGDNFNDETMLDTVGHPFIMAHAVPALHKTGYHSCKKVLPVLEAIAEAKGDINKALRLCE